MFKYLIQHSSFLRIIIEGKIEGRRGRTLYRSNKGKTLCRKERNIMVLNGNGWRLLH